jgi:DNA topoisomerase VI subunit B
MNSSTDTNTEPSVWSGSPQRGGQKMSTLAKLQRTAFRTSRLLDFCNRKELIAQTGHQPDAWPLVILKELIDNALDACEDTGTPPEIAVKVTADGIEVSDNGPGIPGKTVEGVLDFAVRVSTREAYVSPCRGAQGNALKTIVAMPFVLDGEEGHVEVEAHGTIHRITMRVDRIRQQPVVDQAQELVSPAPGTRIRVRWPDSACSILRAAEARFLQIAADYAFLNPHLSIAVDWFGSVYRDEATAPAWKKWLPSNPTSPHWYTPESFERLVAAYIGHGLDAGSDRTVRELLAEFRGLKATAKQKDVLGRLGLARTNLSDLAEGGVLRSDRLKDLLAAMKENSRPVKPQDLGLIGREHLAERFKALGCDMESFDYRKAADTTDGIPWVIETAFAWCPQARTRRLVTGVNWSPGILNPFRELGKFGESLDSVLERQRAGKAEPIILLLHMACPRVEYTDRGKSAVVVSGGPSPDQEAEEEEE